MGTMPGEKGVRTSNHISKRGQFQEQNDQHIQKRTIRGQEVVSTAKNRAGRGSCVQKGMIVGRKGSICPKRDSSRARNGRHIQKRGRKGFVCPERDDSGRERVSAAKHRAGSGSCVQKRTIPGKKGSACPKMGQEGVRVSKKGRFRARNERRVQKRGRKGSICPKKGRFRARRGRHVQKRTIPGKKGSAHPNRAGTGPKKDGSGQEGLGESKI